MALSKSFKANMMLAEENVKEFYSLVKNELKRYGLSSRVNWNSEAFKLDKDLVAKLQFSGKTLGLYIALNVNEVDEMFKVEDVTEKEELSGLYKVNNGKRAKLALDLIALLAKKYNLERKDSKEVDYAKDFPSDTESSLLEKGLIKEEVTKKITKVAKKEVEVKEEIIQPEVVETKVEVKTNKPIRTSKKATKVIVNLDILSQYFNNGSKVSLENMKEVIPNFDKRAVSVKVLGRGELTKKLEVFANSFSNNAIKKIINKKGNVAVVK